MKEVAGEEYRPVAVSQTLDQFSHLDHPLGVQTVCGLVKKHDVGVTEECVGDP